MLSLFRILATAIWGVSRGGKTDFVQAPYIPSNGASHAGPHTSCSLLPANSCLENNIVNDSKHITSYPYMLSLFIILATAIWGVSRGEKTDFVQAPYIPSNGASHAGPHTSCSLLPANSCLENNIVNDSKHITSYPYMLSLFIILATAIWGVSRGEKTDFVQAPYTF